MPQFVHLKLHSEYSLVDGMIRLESLLNECINRKIPAIAITDVCNMFAAIKFYKAALPTVYISPVVFSAYSFITFFQWSS